MNASTVTSTPQAPTQLPAPVHNLILQPFSQSVPRPHSGTLDPQELQIRATTITVLLEEILVKPDHYRDFGIND